MAYNIYYLLYYIYLVALLAGPQIAGCCLAGWLADWLTGAVLCVDCAHVIVIVIVIVILVFISAVVNRHEHSWQCERGKCC